LKKSDATLIFQKPLVFEKGLHHIFVKGFIRNILKIKYLRPLYRNMQRSVFEYFTHTVECAVDLDQHTPHTGEIKEDAEHEMAKAVYDTNLLFLENKKKSLGLLLKSKDPYLTWIVTFTSKFSVNRNNYFERRLKALIPIQYSQDFSYVVYPAFQKKGKLHYHGIFIYEKPHVILGNRMIGEMEIRQGAENLSCLGHIDWENFKRDTKAKTFDGPVRIKEVCDYIFSDKNYLNATDHDIITNIV